VKVKPLPTEIRIDEIRQLLDEAERRPLTKDEVEKLFNVALSYCQLGELLADSKTTLAKLRKMLFGPSSEKSDAVLGKPGAQAPDPAGSNADGGASASSAKDQAGASGNASGDANQQADTDKKTPSKGHGRNGAKDYTGAERTCVPHETLRPGDRCPVCGKGKVYKMAEPKVIVRFTGGPPLQARVWEMERLRCNLCSEIFTAKRPDGVLGDEKYDATAGSMIGLLRYGSGLPFNRLDRLQGELGVPLPVSTQWDLVEACAKKLEPAFQELVRQAAQADVVHNDDTSMEILALRAWLRDRPVDKEDDRNGIFTTGIVACVGERKIALFFTGRQHAGENLAKLLQKRDVGSPAPIQMCDGLSRNLPKKFAIVLSNCLVHGRRQFVNIVDNFPAECRHVLEALREVYHYDAEAKTNSLSPKQRLAFHQEHSGPVMDRLKLWLEAQIAEHKAEPNSGLGKAINYLLTRWEPLTLFLRSPGAPLDNNVCERALKQAIVHRKNSLFYKTPNGAHVGDVFMSLIYTAMLCGAVPFDYLNELQRHADHVARCAAAWMPWNYLAASTAASAQPTAGDASARP
jgi:transposase